MKSLSTPLRKQSSLLPIPHKKAPLVLFYLCGRGRSLDYRRGCFSVRKLTWKSLSTPLRKQSSLLPIPHKKAPLVLFYLCGIRESVTLVDILLLVRQAHHCKISHSLDLHSGWPLRGLRQPSVRLSSPH